MDDQNPLNDNLIAVSSEHSYSGGVFHKAYAFNGVKQGDDLNGHGFATTLNSTAKIVDGEDVPNCGWIVAKRSEAAVPGRSISYAKLFHINLTTHLPTEFFFIGTNDVTPDSSTNFVRLGSDITDMGYVSTGAHYESTEIPVPPEANNYDWVGLLVKDSTNTYSPKQVTFLEIEFHQA